MDEILKRSHILILIAVLISGIAFISRPTYAGGAFSEIPYSVRSTEYDESAKYGRATVKWSKAYSRMTDGTITDVSGYEIQYAPNSSFKNAKKVIKTKTAKKATIKLKALNSRKKYRKYIGYYHFRVRSFVTVDGKKTYSKWAEAASAKAVTVYSPVTLTSIKADRNTVTAEWDPVEGANGYIVFGKKAGAAKWKKKAQIDGPLETEFKDTDLSYSCEYMYSVMSVRTQVTTDPASLNTSYLVLLNDVENNVYRVKTKKFNIETPEVRAVFDGTVLDITWYAAQGAEDYVIQISRMPDFPEDYDEATFDAGTRIYEISHDQLPVDEEVHSYTMERDDVAHENYYVRVKAKGTYKNKQYESDWSEAKFAEYGAGIYTIVFDGNNATSGEMQPCIAGEGEEVRLPDNTYSREGYKFVGWCQKSANQLYLDSETPIQFGMPEYEDQGTVKDLADVDGTIKLYACWQGDGPEAAADWAATIAADDDFVYGPTVKNHCWFCKGGEKFYICNAFVAAAYSHGMPHFEGYCTGSTEWKWWLSHGFKDVGENVPAKDIRKGDIICCWVRKSSRWGHILIASTDGTDKNPRVAHAAGKGMDAKSIREDPMGKRLAKYSTYHVVRVAD